MSRLRVCSVGKAFCKVCFPTKNYSSQVAFISQSTFSSFHSREDTQHHKSFSEIYRDVILYAWSLANHCGIGIKRLMWNVGRNVEQEEQVILLTTKNRQKKKRQEHWMHTLCLCVCLLCSCLFHAVFLVMNYQLAQCSVVILLVLSRLFRRKIFLLVRA